MQFQSSFITQAGSNLFASATSSTNGSPSTPIVWVYARTYNLDTSGYTADQMRALDVTALTTGSGNKQTSVGNVTSAEPCDATDSSSGTPVQIPTVRLTCTLSNEGTYYGPARNLAVFAKLKGQADTSAVLVAVARVDSGHPVDEIPRKADADFSATIDFVLAIKDSQINTIQAPASYYASAQTVQALADRVVTTHLANNTTTGEDQNIYGIKTFKNNTKHTGDILPTVNNTYSLGNTESMWSNIYATYLRLGTYQNANDVAVDAHLNVWSTASTADQRGIDVTGNLNPASSSTYSLGNASYRWQNLYANNIYVGSTSTNITSYISNASVNYATSAGSATSADTATNLSAKPSLSFSAATSSSAGSTLTVTAGSKTSNAITIDKVRQAYGLVNKPSISWTPASSSSAGSTITVTAGGQTSPSITVGTVRKAYSPYAESVSDDANYCIMLGDSFGDTANISSGFKNLHTDTVNSFYYNPSSNQLRAPKIDSTTVSATNVLASYLRFKSTNLKFLYLYIQNPTNKTLYIREDTYSVTGYDNSISLIGWDAATASMSTNSWYCTVSRYSYFTSNSSNSFTAGPYHTDVTSLAQIKMLSRIILEANTTKYYAAIILANY